MKVKIVKLINGNYVVRKGIFFMEYADIDNLKANSPICWWTNPRHEWCQCADINKLKELIANYSKIIKEEQVIETVDLKV
jgi:hypothetical protein